MLALPMVDEQATATYYQALGWYLDSKYCRPGSLYFDINPTACLMFFGHEEYAAMGGTQKDYSHGSETRLALDMTTKDAVDEIMALALAAGGTEPIPAMDMPGLIYGRFARDPNGNVFQFYCWF